VLETYTPPVPASLDDLLHIDQASREHACTAVHALG
jgi:hypothetical protein